MFKTAYIESNLGDIFGFLDRLTLVTIAINSQS